MKTRKRSLKRFAIGGMALVGLACFTLGFTTEGVKRANTGMADPLALMTTFDRYLTARSTGNSFLTFPLTSLRGLSSESFNAGGTVRIDPGDSVIYSEIMGLPQDVLFDLWLIDNRAGPGN